MEQPSTRPRVGTQAAQSQYKTDSRTDIMQAAWDEGQPRSKRAWDAGASINAVRVVMLTGLHRATMDLREDIMADIRASDVLTFNDESLKLCSNATRILIADFQARSARRGAGLE